MIRLMRALLQFFLGRLVPLLILLAGGARKNENRCRVVVVMVVVGSAAIVREIVQEESLDHHFSCWEDLWNGPANGFDRFERE
jgi:hypothetical protein